MAVVQKSRARAIPLPPDMPGSRAGSDRCMSGPCGPAPGADKPAHPGLTLGRTGINLPEPRCKLKGAHPCCGMNLTSTRLGEEAGESRNRPNREITYQGNLAAGENSLPLSLRA
ncbi:hypothetical protein Bbelb_033320 [Branchiostoma belcheri]|nr:hypothetical protein Bbelb_033320 [Branchiostoma belcheri]